jgi:hypothetical protein
MATLDASKSTSLPGAFVQRNSIPPMRSFLEQSSKGLGIGPERRQFFAIGAAAI